MTHSSTSATVSMRNKFSSGFKFLSILLLVLLVSGKMAGQILLSEGFEGNSGAIPPTGWLNSSSGFISATQPNSGTYCAAANGVNDALTSPLLTNPGTLSFWYKRSGTAPTTPKWSVYRATSTSGPWTQVGSSITSFSTTYAQFSVDLSTYTNIYIKIVDERASGTNSIYLDDISVTTSEPTTQTSAITFSPIATTSMTVNWTSGNGGRRAVFMKAGSGTITNPTDGVAYSASADWNAKGTQLGTSGYYCIYNGTGTSVALTNLVASTTYYIQSFEYNSDNNTTPTATTINYFTNTATGNPNSQATTSAGGLTPPTLSAAVSPTVDADFAVTFPDNATWRAATPFTVKYGSTTLTAVTDYTLTSGTLTLKPSGTVNSVLRTAGTQTLTITANGYLDATVQQPIAAGAAAKLQLLMPGETAAANTTSGKTGTPTAQVAGTAFNATVNSTDQYWNLVSTTRTIGITSSDVNAVLPSNAALSAGTGTYSVTFKTAASATVTATDQSGSPLTAIIGASTSVSAGAVNKLQLLMPGEVASPGSSTGKTLASPTTQVAGTQFAITVNAVDANWNVVTSNSSSVSITSSDANATLPGSSSLSSGTKTFNVTLKTAGSFTVTATTTGLSTNTSVSPSTTVNAGAATKLQLLMPGEVASPGSSTGKTSATPTPQTAGSAFNVTVNSVDANWNVVSNTSTVVISSTDANAILPSNAALVAGTGTFSVTCKTAGSKTVTATDNALTLTANTGTSTTINAGALNKLQLLMPGEVASAGSSTGKTAASPTAQVTGVAFSITVNAVDAYWNVVSSSTDNIAITSTDASATMPNNAALASGTITFPITLATAGTSTLTASDATNAGITNNTSPSFTVTQGTAASDYFRSKTSGNWNSTSTWESSSNNSTWMSATLTPTSSANTITILNTHTVTVSAPVTVDQLVVNTGGQITVSSGVELKISNGVGTDFSVAGTVVNSGTITLQGATTSTVDGTLTNSGTLTLSTGTTSLTINGIFNQSTITLVGNSGTITFAAASTYNHTVNGGTIPAASWNLTSTCNITGITSTIPSGLTQSFGNFTWNCTGQSASLHLNNTLNTINGNFNLTASNGWVVRLNDAADGNSSLAVAGNFSIGATGALNLNYGATTGGTGTLNLSGNLTIASGGILTQSSTANKAVINFNGTGVKQINNLGTKFNNTNAPIDINVNAGTLQLLSNITLNNYSFNASNVTTLTVLDGAKIDFGTYAIINGTNTSATGIATTVTPNFILNSGSTAITANAAGLTSSGATGSVQTTGTRTYSSGANYEFQGAATGAFTTSPTANTVNNLTINKSAGVTLSQALTVNGILTFTSGILTTTGANVLTIGNTSSSAISGTSTTAYVSGPMRWTLPSNLASGSTYLFPIGKSSTYYPLSLVNPVTGVTGSVISAEAFATTTGGSAGSGISSISTTEYWQASVVSGNLNSSDLSITRQSALGSFNTVAKSSTLTGSYDNLGGTPSVTSINNTNDAGSSLGYFVMGVYQAQTASPSLTAASNVTVDAAFAITFTDDEAWRGAISSIKVGGTTLDPLAYDKTVANQITFTPSASTLLQTPGSKSIVIVATGYLNASVSQSIAVGAANKLSVTTQPTAPLGNGAVLVTQPVVAIVDQYGNATTSTASVVATIGAGAWTVGGTTTKSGVAGTATFTDLTATCASAVTGATITFTSTGLTQVTSSGFNVPILSVQPTAPSTLTFGSVLYNSFTASFTAPGTPPAGYLVLRRSGSAVTGSPVAGTQYTQGDNNINSGVNQVVYIGSSAWSTYSQFSLSDNTAYYYAVYSYNGSGVTTNYSTALTGNQSTTVITSPTATSATSVGSAGFTANWGAVTDASGYKLDVSTIPSFTTTSTGTLTENFTGFTGTSPFNGWTFDATIGNYTTGTSSGPSGANSVKFLASGTSGVALSPTLTGTATQLSFYLINNSSTGSTFLVEGYNGSGWVTVQSIGSTSVASTPGTQFIYNSGTTPALPANITQFRFTYTKSGGNLAFDDVSIDYSTVMSSILSGYNDLPVSGTSQAVSGLSANTSYYYRVRAVGSNGASANSSTVTAITALNTSVNASSLPVCTTCNIAVVNGGTLTNDGNADRTYNSISVAGGAKLTNPSGSTLRLSSLTLNSDGNGTGTYVDKGTSYITSATVNQNLASVRNWYISSPVTTADRSMLPSGTLWKYNEPNTATPSGLGTALWEVMTTNEAIGVMKGYILKPDATGTISFTGTLNTGNQSITLNRTENTQLKRGFNLVGNPYPSYLDWMAAINASNTSTLNLMTTLWYRTQNPGNPSATPTPIPAYYVFDTYNETANTGTNNNGNGAVTGFIPPMQAFWVRVIAAGDGSTTTGTLAVTNAMRSHESGTNRMKAPALSSQPMLRLQVSNGSNSDEAIVLFNPNASDAFDAFDSPKMTNGNAAIPEIYTVAGTEQLVINGLKTLPSVLELPLGFTTGQSNTFTIKASEISNFAADTRIYLVDKVLNTDQELTADAVYSFTSDKVSTTDRFALIFKTPSITDGLNAVDEGSFWISGNSTNEIIVHGLSDAKTAVEIYNEVGQKLVSNTLMAANKALRTPRLVPGVYMVTVSSEGKKITRKVILK